MDYLQPPVIPRLDELELRRFVLGVVDGQVFTTAHMSQGDVDRVLSLVFMPLMASIEPTPGLHVPPRPMCPEAPKPAGKKPYLPEALVDGKPVEPKKIEPELKRVEDLEFRIRWGRTHEVAVLNYLTEIAEQNTQLREKYEAELLEYNTRVEAARTTWQALCVEVDAQNAKIEADNAAAHAAWVAANDQAIRDQAEWEAMVDRWRHDYFAQVGVIWEWMSEAKSRSVNGYPTFMSARFIHLEDWARARPAIEREQNRRQNIEV